jgi:hypothetical protein
LVNSMRLSLMKAAHVGVGDDRTVSGRVPQGRLNLAQDAVLGRLTKSEQSRRDG